MRLGIQGRIVAMVAVFLLSLVVLGGIQVVQTRALLLTEKRVKTRQLVEVAITLAAHFHAQEKAGRLTRDEAQRAARAAIRGLRYAEVEYFWVQDAEVPRLLVHPTHPEIEGERFDGPQFRGVTEIEPDGMARETFPEGGMTLGRATQRVVEQAAGGFVTYQWTKPVKGQQVTTARYPKLSYVRLFEPWQWVLGSGVYIDDVDAMARHIAWRNLLWIAAVGGVFAVIAVLIARSIIRPLRRSTRQMEAMVRSAHPLAALPVERDDEVGALVQVFNQLQMALREREQRLLLAANVFVHAREAIMVTTAEGDILDVNEAFTRITGYTRDEVFGRQPRLLSSGRHDATFYANMWQRLKAVGEWQGEIWNRRKNGEVYPEQLTISAVQGEDGAPRQYVAIFTDITERKRLEAQIEHLAYYDPLTDLPNRRLLQDRLRQAMAVCKREQMHAALLLLDLDNFKPLNDNHGHEAGDLLLIEAARRIQGCLRAVDTVARLGGDEFVVILGGLDEARDPACEQAAQVAEKILDALSMPYRLAVRGKTLIEHRCTASIGIHVFFRHDESEEEIVKSADLAMYQAKEAGRGVIRFSDREPPGDAVSLRNPDSLHPQDF